jgi:uncharacterized protein YkwD
MATLPPLDAIDALLAVVVLLGLWRGWRQGFVVAALQLLVLAASVVLAFFAYPYAAALLQGQADALGAWRAPLAFVASYAVAQLILDALARRVVRAVPLPAHAHRGNRALGLLPGAASGLVHAMVAALLLLTLPLPAGWSALARQSALASRLAAPAPWLEAQLAPIFQPAVERTLQALTAPAEPHATRQLHYRLDNAKVRADLEARMLALVNAERAANGLPPLQADPALAEVARAHSRDMFARGYFSHANPEGQQASDRMRKAGVPYLVAGENLALAPTLAMAHQGLMNSPGHRDNILRPQYGRVGIGVLDGGGRGLMVTQNFRN